MSQRSIAETVQLAIRDIRENSGRRIRHGLAWRLRRLKNASGRVLRLGFTNANGRDEGPAPLGPHIYSVEFGQTGHQVLQHIYDRLGSNSVGFMIGGGNRMTAKVIHIAAEDIHLVASGVLEFCEATGVRIMARERGRWRSDLTAEVVEELTERKRSFELVIVERETGGVRTHLQCSRLEVAVWERHTGYDRAYRESDRSFEIVGRLREQTFNRYMRDGHRFDDDFPAPAYPMFPIDVVYTWVDGEDEAWLAQKDRFSDGATLRHQVAGDERYRSRDELRYSLRSVELFAPWVRKIHIVTADQCPEWLDVDHPKINLVSHEDIFTDSSWLPTFNSSGIETQLHHIPGLARKFLYFNDDFFLGQLSDPIDFFYPNGVLKYFPSTQRAYEPDIDRRSDEYVQADRNVVALLQQSSPSVGRSIMKHAPYPSDRQLLSELEKEFKAAFERCAAARFRSADDIRPIAFMQYHYGFQTGRAMPSNISHRYLALWKPHVVEQMVNFEAGRTHKTLCINDYGLEEDRVEEVNKAVVEFLDSYFPDPSSFEKQ